MSELSVVRKGLEIVERRGCRWCMAEHDVLYVDRVELPSEEARQLEELGWYFDKDLGQWYVYT